MSCYRIDPPCSGGGIDSVDARGAFELEGFPPGTYRITAECVGIGMARLSRTLEPLEACDLGDVVLSAPARIALSVSDGDGPLQDAEARAVVCDVDRVFIGLIRLEAGEGLSDGLAPGDYRVIVRAPHRAIARTNLTLEAGATQSTELTLQSGVRVRITMPVATEGSVELRDAQGVTIDWLWRSRDTNAEHAVWLRPGTYSLEPTKGRAHRFTVNAGASELAVDVPGW